MEDQNRKQIEVLVFTAISQLVKILEPEAKTLEYTKANKDKVNEIRSVGKYLVHQLTMRSLESQEFVLSNKSSEAQKAYLKKILDDKARLGPYISIRRQTKDNQIVS